MRKYRFRIVDQILKNKLNAKGAVLIEGPKWCGKTTTAEQIAQSFLYMNDSSRLSMYMQIAEMSPAELLRGENPRLIDEWQVAPTLWDAVCFEVDHRGAVGQFILTGSAVPVDRKRIQHTGTGRFAWLMMRSMSLFESGDSSGDISLGDLFQQPEKIFAENKLKLEDIAYLICRGGWPMTVDMKQDTALEQAFDYYDAVVNSDVSRVDNTLRNPERVKRIMRSYSRHQGQQVSINKLCADVKANDVETLSENTVASYINALKQIFVIEDVTAWNPNLRSKTVIRTSDTRYFVDPSIAVAALGIGPKDLMQDLNTMGLLFETMAIRDLRVFAESLNGMLYHYRDRNGLECDAVVHLRNGNYGLIEIKLGGERLIEDGVKTLDKLNGIIDTKRMKSPAFKMVLTAIGQYAYRRKDGVYVVPIGCLKN